ncbi:hypothetical protein HN695_01995 [Candidatus Woesearchaeota archaeon]|nr:hypothetical protein [Candidatus Woesearchaeota archaeon]MBT5273171.1 hypothetical protein [Candidatus Woesearchaeota archaeon]MBT6041198.1 hypothetical protein [Candidatus Woesearchaeota archaeon]MBT6337514.1 hypothetical protein [Candidatus Woesearchaeota archaeon]MBT7927085.1 hypothetical protein [Candidatus Woesearchaeota archaeon]
MSLSVLALGALLYTSNANAEDRHAFPAARGTTYDARVSSSKPKDAIVNNGAKKDETKKEESATAGPDPEEKVIERNGCQMPTATDLAALVTNHTDLYTKGVSFKADVTGVDRVYNRALAVYELFKESPAPGKTNLYPEAIYSQDKKGSKKLSLGYLTDMMKAYEALQSYKTEKATADAEAAKAAEEKPGAEKGKVEYEGALEERAPEDRAVPEKEVAPIAAEEAPEEPVAPVDEKLESLIADFNTAVDSNIDATKKVSAKYGVAKDIANFFKSYENGGLVITKQAVPETEGEFVYDVAHLNTYNTVDAVVQLLNNDDATILFAEAGKLNALYDAFCPEKADETPEGPMIPLRPTCDDEKQNGDETGVDCGGSCELCADVIERPQELTDKEKRKSVDDAVSAKVKYFNIHNGADSVSGAIGYDRTFNRFIMGGEVTVGGQNTITSTSDSTDEGGTVGPVYQKQFSYETTQEGQDVIDTYGVQAVVGFKVHQPNKDNSGFSIDLLLKGGLSVTLNEVNDTTEIEVYEQGIAEPVSNKVRPGKRDTQADFNGLYEAMIRFNVGEEGKGFFEIGGGVMADKKYRGAGGAVGGGFRF